MSYSLIAHAISGGAPNGATTAGINTTGANLIVLAIAGTGTMTVSDSNGNTWTACTNYSGSGGEVVRLYYCYSPTVGAGHTFTVSGTSTYSVIEVSAWSGAATSPLDQQNGANNSSTTIQPGSITPAQNNELVITAVNYYISRSYSSISGATFLDSLDGANNNNYGLAVAYNIQTTAAAINPTWTFSTSNYNTACIASFKAAAGSGSVGSAAGSASVSGKSGSKASAAGAASSKAQSGSKANSTGQAAVAGRSGSKGSSAGQASVSGRSGSLGSAAGSATVIGRSGSKGSASGGASVSGVSRGGSTAAAAGVAAVMGRSGSIAIAMGSCTVVGRSPSTPVTTELLFLIPLGGGINLGIKLS